MRYIIFFHVLWVWIGLSSSAYACTSFALYGPQIFYGMNFDYFTIPLKVLIESNMGMNIFHLSFLYDQTVDDPVHKGCFAKTCGMNNKGLFCSSQEIEPYIEGRKKAGRSEVHIDDQYEALSSHSLVEQVEKSISGKAWIQYIGPSIHNLFADTKGNAMVTETDNKDNFITRIDGRFMVMSNFSNHILAGKPYTEAVGTGADRYISAYEYLAENIETFCVEKGFELLEKVSLNEKDCATLCSMIFSPQTNSVYIALDRNFDVQWKVSLSTRTIESYKGVKRFFQTGLGADGILVSDLIHLGI